MSRLGARFAACPAVSVVSLSLLAVVSPDPAAAVEAGSPLPPAPANTVANGVAYVGATVYASFRPAGSLSAMWQHFDFRRQRAGILRIGGGMRVDAVAVIR